jgi:hypothetical protein
MEKINYISGKEANFWKILRNVAAVISWLSMSILMFSEERKIFLFFVSSATLFLSLLAEIPQHFSDKDISEIRKRVRWNAGMYAAGLVVFALLMVFLPVKTAFVVLVTIVYFIIIVFTVFRKKMQNSSTLLRFMVSDKPGLFYKDIFTNNYLESVFAITAMVAVYAGLIALMIWVVK